MSKKSSQLIIFASDKDYYLKEKYHGSYIYCIGSGKAHGNDLYNLNDPERLNSIAEERRDRFSQWVYNLNDYFKDNNIVHNQALSLYFLTDFSCKRSEIFKTYNSICNLNEIKSQIDLASIEKVIFIGVSESFVQAAKSLFKEIDYEYFDIRTENTRYIRSFIKNNIYFFKMLAISFLNLFIPKSKVKARRLFLTRYPLHFIDDDDLEDKYGPIDLGNDNFSVSIATDDFHQKVSLIEYWRYTQRCLIKNFSLIDPFLKSSDVFEAFFGSIALYKKWKKLTKQDFFFEEINISKYCKTELIFSFDRVVRLIMWDKIVRRYLTANKSDEFVYYLHEYPYGRLFSYILSSYPEIHTVAMQSGPASYRKMLYFLGKGEVGETQNYLQHVPIPNEVLAEDKHSASIYLHAGYPIVSIMKSIKRLSYLDPIIKGEPQYTLICPGLHDGELMLNTIKEEIIASPDHLFIIKPHPRGSKGYLKKYNFNNLEVSSNHIAALLGNAGKVVVTYSSVGAEAEYLGIETQVINVPGTISESPLLDRKHAHDI